MKLNLISIAAINASTFQLRNGQDELLWSDGQPVNVTVYGPGSKEYQKASAKATARAMERMKARSKFEQSADEKLVETANHLADITVGFDNLDYDGLTGRDLAVGIYGDAQLGFIAEQVNKHSADWANFTKGSPAN